MCQDAITADSDATVSTPSPPRALVRPRLGFTERRNQLGLLSTGAPALYEAAVTRVGPRHDTPTPRHVGACRGCRGPKQTGWGQGVPYAAVPGGGGAPGEAGQGPRGASSTVLHRPVQHGGLPPAPGPTGSDIPGGCRRHNRHVEVSGNPPTSPDMTPRHVGGVGVSGCRGQLWL